MNQVEIYLANSASSTMRSSITKISCLELNYSNLTTALLYHLYDPIQRKIVDPTCPKKRCCIQKEGL